MLERTRARLRQLGTLAVGTLAGPDVLTPVVIGSTGRSGTTLLMQLLGTSPRVVFDRIYAFEHAYLAYLWHWARLPEEGLQRGDHWHRAALDQEDWLARPDGRVGGIPWSARPCIGEDGPPLAHEILRATWREFSDRARQHQLTAQGSWATHYAETAPPWLVPELRPVFPRLRGGYLLRDPRDQWLSVLAFMDKTGRRSFGFQADDTPETYAASLAARQRDVFRLATQDATTNGDARTIYYEDLVTDIEAEADRIGRWLGLRLDPDQLASASDLQRRHATSDGSSVGRWRREMPPHVAEVFHDTMGPELAAHGYPPS